MLKGIGAGLILFVSVVLGLQFKQRLREHLEHLIRCKEVLLMLSGEMSYAKTPLLEAFLHIADQGKEPFGSFLKEVAKRAEKDRGQSLAQIWRGALKSRQKEICFSREEWILLESLGENFGYLDVQMQLGHLSLCIQQLDANIEKAQRELLDKQKLYQYLSVMCGLFLILVLL